MTWPWIALILGFMLVVCVYQVCSTLMKIEVIRSVTRLVSEDITPDKFKEVVSELASAKRHIS